MPTSPGARLGSYEVLCPLGAGGMGEVYRARDNKFGREVARKVLPDVHADDPERPVPFDRKARLHDFLNHPNINAIHGREVPASRADSEPIQNDLLGAQN